MTRALLSIVAVCLSISLATDASARWFSRSKPAAQPAQPRVSYTPQEQVRYGQQKRAAGRQRLRDVFTQAGKSINSRMKQVGYGLIGDGNKASLYGKRAKLAGKQSRRHVGRGLGLVATGVGNQVGGNVRKPFVAAGRFISKKAKQARDGIVAGAAVAGAVAAWPFVKGYQLGAAGAKKVANSKVGAYTELGAKTVYMGGKKAVGAVMALPKLGQHLTNAVDRNVGLSENARRRFGVTPQQAPAADAVIQPPGL
jgi:hypothetical protein